MYLHALGFQKGPRFETLWSSPLRKNTRDAVLAWLIRNIRAAPKAPVSVPSKRKEILGHSFQNHDYMQRDYAQQSKMQNSAMIKSTSWPSNNKSTIDVNVTKRSKTFHLRQRREEEEVVGTLLTKQPKINIAFLIHVLNLEHCR